MKKNFYINSNTPIYIFDTLESTMNEIKKNKYNSYKEVVVLAQRQTHGRGRRNNTWISDKGNLYLSIRIKQKIKKNHHLLTYMVSIVLYDIIKKYIPKSIKHFIKWPNDIMVNDKKIAGILIENQLLGKNIKFSNIGIGINVNQLNFSNLNATSLSKELNLIRNLKSDKSLIIKHLNINYNTFFYNHNELRKEYLKYLYQYQIIAKYKSNKGFFLGEITGVSEWGKLQVKVDNSIIEFDNKEIEFI